MVSKLTAGASSREKEELSGRRNWMCRDEECKEKGNTEEQAVNYLHICPFYQQNSLAFKGTRVQVTLTSVPQLATAKVKAPNLAYACHFLLKKKKEKKESCSHQTRVQLISVGGSCCSLLHISNKEIAKMQENVCSLSLIHVHKFKLTTSKIRLSTRSIAQGDYRERVF